jgi:hypothetical protein
MKRTHVAVALMVASCLLGCGRARGVGPAEQTVVLGESALEPAMPLRVRAHRLTLSVNPIVQPREHQGRRVWTITGGTSRKLADAHVLGSKDGRGRAAVTGPESFQIELDDRELGVALSGARLLVGFTLAGSAQTYTAAFRLEPRLAGLQGSLSLAPRLTPVFARGALSFRAAVTLPFPADEVSVRVGSGAEPRIERRGPRAWILDWSLPATAVAAAGEPVALRASDGSAAAEATAAMVAAVSEVGVTTRDPQEVWPAPSCRPSIQRCLDQLSEGARDAASCGSYAEVHPCAVTRVLPPLEAADRNEEIAALVREANRTLPKERRVDGVSVYRYEWASWHAPTLGQVLRSYLETERLGGRPPVQGGVERAELERELARYRLDGLVGALRDLLLVDRFEVGKIAVTPSPELGARPRRTHLVLYAPKAAHVVAVRLASHET